MNSSQKNTEVELPSLPFLIFQGKEARIAEEIEGNIIRVTDPDEGKAHMHEVHSSIFRTEEMRLQPVATPTELFGKLRLVTHTETILDPVYLKLPYISLVYQLLEACTNRPAYRIALQRLPGETSYEVRFNLNHYMPELRGQDPICVVTHVWFNDGYCLFTTPTTQSYKALLGAGTDTPEEIPEEPGDDNTEYEKDPDTEGSWEERYDDQNYESFDQILDTKEEENIPPFNAGEYPEIEKGMEAQDTSDFASPLPNNLKGQEYLDNREN